jgi:hypothetical protein
LQVGADLLEGVEDAAGVGDLDAVVSDGLQDAGEDLEELLAIVGDGDGEGAAGDAPGAARLAEGAARGVMVVAEGLASEGGRGAGVSAFKGVRAEDSDVLNDLGAQVWISVQHVYPLPLGCFWTKSSWEKT